MFLKPSFLAWIKTRRGITIMSLGSAILLLTAFLVLVTVYTMQSAATSAEPGESSAIDSFEEISSASESSETESSEEESSEEESSEEEEKDMTVTLAVTTAQNDLRIRFYDRFSNLRTGIQFEVSVQKSGGKATTQKDTDKDGKIDLTKIAAGKYTVTMKVPDGYTSNQTSVTVNVKDKVSYKVLDDVKDEVKDVTEVKNIQQEETKPKPAEPEPEIENTVESVDSTEKETKTYQKIDSSKVQNPYGKLVTVTESNTQTGFVLNYSEVQFVLTDNTMPVSLKPYLNGKLVSVTWVSDHTNIVQVADDGTITPIASGTATVTATHTPAMGGLAPLSEADNDLSAVSESSENDESGISNLAESSAADSSTVSSTDESSVGESGISNLAESSTVNSATESSTNESSTDESSTSDPSIPPVMTASCKITVSALSDSDELFTTDGKNLYVKEGEDYRKALVSDYGKSTDFYIEESAVIYTGWQTAGGKTYYYDESGNYVTGEQTIGGVKYTFDTKGVLISDPGVLGIDISTYQGNIDWKQVKKSGVEFVIIRCGFRGYGTGVLVEDSRFQQNLAGAKAAGLKVGIYFFSQAINEVEAVEEASACIKLLNGASLQYPIFIDIEESGGYPYGRADNLTKFQRTAIVKAFCETVRSVGYRAGIYANKDFLTNHLDANQLNSYVIWLAQYSDEVSYKGSYDIWQYTASGTVSGIFGKVDKNLSYYH